PLHRGAWERLHGSCAEHYGEGTLFSHPRVRGNNHVAPDLRVRGHVDIGRIGHGLPLEEPGLELRLGASCLEPRRERRDGTPPRGPRQTPPRARPRAQPRRAAERRPPRPRRPPPPPRPRPRRRPRRPRPPPPPHRPPKRPLSVSSRTSGSSVGSALV